MDIQKETIANIIWNSNKVLNKVQSMQKAYLMANKGNYTDENLQLIQNALNAVCHKFTLSIIHLEAIWHISTSARNEILTDFENSIVVHSWDDIDKTLGSLQLEAFLFQTRSFLDIYQKYCLTVMGKEVVQISKDDFIKQLSKVDAKYTNTALKIKTYFEEVVYCDIVANLNEASPFECKGWGKLIRNLRNKIAHQNFIKYSYDGTEVIHQIKLDWPSLKGVTYDRFGQLIHNGVFALVQETSSVLYEQEWISG